MEDHWLWYLTGSVDSISTMTVKIQKDDRRNLGYVLSPQLYITRPPEVESILGMVDEYCEEMNVMFRVDELTSSNRIVVSGVNNIRKFLEPIIDGFIQQRDRAEYFLDEVFPKLSGESFKSQEGFIEAMEVVDGLAGYPIQPRGGSKYDSDYFREEWDL